MGFAGSVGWYDYTLRDPRLDGEVLPIHHERGEFRDPRGIPVFWSDASLAAFLAHPNADDWRLRGCFAAPTQLCRVAGLRRRYRYPDAGLSPASRVVRRRGPW